jgi:sugar phosphate isomerase/epimerase
MQVRDLMVFTLIILASIAGVSASAADNGLFVSIRDAYIGAKYFDTPIQGLKELGIDAIEMELGRDFKAWALDKSERVPLTTDDEVKAFRKRADELGVRIWAVMTACDFSAGVQDENIAWIARAIEIADMLGSNTVRIDSAMKRERELSFGDRVNLFVEGLGGALKKTEGSKVTLGIENHGFQGNNLAFLLNVYKQLGSDRLGSTVDMGNFYWRGYPLSEVYGILNLLAPHAKHTHVKNINYPDDQQEVTREAGWEYTKYFCPIEEGDIDVARVVSMLLKSGYKGDICLEDESVEKCKTREGKVDVLKRDIAHLKKVVSEAK